MGAKRPPPPPPTHPRTPLEALLGRQGSGCFLPADVASPRAACGTVAGRGVALRRGPRRRAVGWRRGKATGTPAAVCAVARRRRSRAAVSAAAAPATADATSMAATADAASVAAPADATAVAATAAAWTADAGSTVVADSTRPPSAKPLSSLLLLPPPELGGTTRPRALCVELLLALRVMLI